MIRLNAPPAKSSAATGGLLAGVLLVMWLAAAAYGQAPSSAPATDSGDVMRGWRVFHEKQCVACHAIWGQGGEVGPDLGRIRSGRLSGAQLAGIMWNHIPKMFARMKQAGQAQAKLSESEMSDLFALLYFVRQLDELGDPARGEVVLRDKGCTQCHSINTPEGGIGPDLAMWGSYANPIIWAQMMWEHAPVMEEAMRRSGLTWPKLEGDDLEHIVAYVRSAGTSGEKKYLRPGSLERGRRLFLEKQCDACHPGAGPDLASKGVPTSAGALASRMWNHSPEMTRVMRERDVARQAMTPQEMADILAYVLALGNQDRPGDSARGRELFARKGCAQCHESDSSGRAAGPALRWVGEQASVVNAATAMWNHGEMMVAKMTEAGMSWPVFADDEMADLLAYLQVTRSSGATAQSRPAAAAE